MTNSPGTTLAEIEYFELTFIYSREEIPICRGDLSGVEFTLDMAAKAAKIGSISPDNGYAIYRLIGEYPAFDGREPIPVETGVLFDLLPAHVRGAVGAAFPPGCDSQLQNDQPHPAADSLPAANPS